MVIVKWQVDHAKIHVIPGTAISEHYDGVTKTVPVKNFTIQIDSNGKASSTIDDTNFLQIEPVERKEKEE